MPDVFPCSQMKFLIELLAICRIRSNPSNIVHPLLRHQNLDEAGVAFIGSFLATFLTALFATLLAR